MTRVLCCSTYELGAQPLGCAVPAAVLTGAGHEVRSVDLSIDLLDSADLSWAEAVAFSVPMHTAVRLGLAALERVRMERPGVPVAFHGLYAPIAALPGRFFAGDLIAAGMTNDALIEWADGAALRAHTAPPVRSDGPSVRITLSKKDAARDAPIVPLRAGLPGLDRYARLIGHGPERLVGTVETTTGCNHRCRHCPVPVVFNGRSRVGDPVALLADIDQLAAAGAEHLHFGDPDFLNRPAHALRIVTAAKAAHPKLSFDATIKVSHILRHRDVLGQLADLGLLFVISAFESTSDVVLTQLDKGHCAADLPVAIEALRSFGVEVRPSLLPFTPWTTRDDVIAIFDLVARHDLIDNVDPIQYGIRLLLPPGSLLLDGPDPVLSASLTTMDPAGIAMQWRSPDPVLDELAGAIIEAAERAELAAETPSQTYRHLRELVHSAFGRADAGAPEPIGRRGPASRPKLSESWFCCAEPTTAQRDAIGRIS